MGSVGMSVKPSNTIPWECRYLLECSKTIEEVRYAFSKANKGKALGNEQIPDLHNDLTKIIIIYCMFYSCTVPVEWSCGPKNNRVITIMSSVYKIFCCSGTVKNREFRGDIKV